MFTRFAMIVCLSGLLYALGGCDSGARSPATRPAPVTATSLKPSDDALLEDLERRGFLFFWEQADPTTGLVADRASADGGPIRGAASIASTGFGLTGLCIAAERGWITREQAHDRALLTLRALRDTVPNERGFYYHFVDPRTGKRDGQCELSSIDTALLMAGVLTVRQQFPGTDVNRLATELYERVEWPWMLNGGKTFSMGWTPEHGFLDARWDNFSEHAVLSILAIASPTHPVPAECWDAWSRKPVVTYDGKTFMQCPPLFTHQFSHAWVDFRNQRDAYADYWRNSVLATLAHRQFCIDLSATFPGYGPDTWGITSSDGPDGYKSWGGPPATASPPIDGSVVPCAAAGSLPFAKSQCLSAIGHMKDKYGDRAWKRYGFVDAFNPNSGWVNGDVIGIDLGITLLMAENCRSGLVWGRFMANPEIRPAMQRIGFRSTDPTIPDEDRKYLTELARETWQCIDQMVAPSGLPYDNQDKHEWTSVSNIGLYLTDIAAARSMGWISDTEAAARVDATLSSIEKLKTFHGFQQCWNSVKTLGPADYDPMVSVLDTGNFIGGLITVGRAFPQFSSRTDRLIAAMDWSSIYDTKRKALWGGYNTKTQSVNPDWHVDLLGTDARLAAFAAVASGKVPKEAWQSLTRSLESRYKVRYLVPGWQGGGLFMQYINGIWLDDRDTLMGRSAENFAYAQMRHADAIGAPVWGWSACSGPDGTYLGWGGMKDEVVTPHASALAIASFPREVVANLRHLERMGVRKVEIGFLDSVDWRSGQIRQGYLVLDQSMLMLSLVNYLQDGIVQKWVQSDPMVQRGRQLIDDYRVPAYAQNSLCDLAGRTTATRDQRPRSTRAMRFDNWATADWQVLDIDSLEGGDAGVPDMPVAKFAFAWDGAGLHFSIRVVSKTVTNTRPADKLYEQDAIELYIDPANDGLAWGQPADFQFGFAAPDKTWEWFGSGRRVPARITSTAEGYSVESVIPWSTLGVKPGPGLVLGVSPALHYVSPDGTNSVKLNWCWRPEGERVHLGALTLQ